MGRIEILNIPFDDISKTDAAAIIAHLCRVRGAAAHTVVTPNPVMVMNAQENKRLASAIRCATLSLPDGVGIISASRRLGTPLRERVTGIDTAHAVIGQMNETGGSLYLLGAKPGVAQKAAESLKKEFPNIRVLGTHDGYFADDEEIIEEINEKAPDLLILCLGSPRQELWAHGYRARLNNVGVIMCLGGALDVWSGNIKRAPSAFIKLRLEWLWRMMREPKRLKELPKMVKFRIKSAR